MKVSRWVFILALLSLVLAVVASTLLTVLPVYSSVSQSSSDPAAVSGSATLLQVNGYGVLIPLVIPVILTGAGLLAVLWMQQGKRHAKLMMLISTALLIIFVLLSGFSIGDYYAPAALVMMVAAALTGLHASAPPAA